MAGPLAGSTGLGPLRFFAANLFAALLYVPVVVSAGYAIGYGLGDRIERLRHAAGHAERAVLIALALAVLLGWLVLAFRARRRA
jgi:membrane protein DedA with SNARE-associated domain